MTKLCPRGKAAAKRKFKVYPSAYANAYASKICAGKIKDPSGVKRKDFRGSKAKGGRIGYKDGDTVGSSNVMNVNLLKEKLKEAKPTGKIDDLFRMKSRPRRGKPVVGKAPPIQKTEPPKRQKPISSRSSRMGGGLMEATARLKRQGLRGGGICTKGMNRDAVGKNS